MKAIYSQLIKPGDLCFDIGAHAGKRTRTMLECGARVVAVEPIKWRADAIKRNMPEVEVVNAACGSEPGAAMLSVSGSDDTISTLSADFMKSSRFAAHNFTWPNKVPVTVTTLDELVVRFGMPVFCKIDVEGGEFSVLSGMTGTLPSVSYEFHEEFMGEARGCMSNLECRPTRIECNVSIGESGVFALDKWVKPDELFAAIPSLPTCEWGRWGDIYARAIL